jgi:protein-tyrosine phosphatase
MVMNDIDDVQCIRVAHAQRDDPHGPDEAGIVVLCTANVCRSPMAAALLARRLAALGVTVPVRSAGMLRRGDPPRPEVVSIMAVYGIAIASHRSRIACIADLADAALVLAMTREHLRYAVVTEPGAWPRTFTLRELVRRGTQIGPRRPGEPLSGWLARAHAGRDRASLLGDRAEDDVPDPAGGPPRAFADTASLLDRLVADMVELGWGHGGPHP